MKRQLSAEGNYTEEELEEYMQSHKKLMIDSLWKLNVADIEATLSRVCQMVVHTLSCCVCSLFFYCSYLFVLIFIALLGSTRQQRKERRASCSCQGVEDSRQNFSGTIVDQ